MVKYPPCIYIFSFLDKKQTYWFLKTFLFLYPDTSDLELRPWFCKKNLSVFTFIIYYLNIQQPLYSLLLASTQLIPHLSSILFHAVDLTGCQKHCFGILAHLICCSKFVSCTFMMLISCSSTSQSYSAGWGSCRLVQWSLWHVQWTIPWLDAV